MCLIHANKTDKEGECCRDFSHSYELTQIIDEPTQVPETTRQAKVPGKHNLSKTLISSWTEKHINPELSPILAKWI